MYCIQCGVRLADPETSCPLCGTAPGAEIAGPPRRPLYPREKYPVPPRRSHARNGCILFLFLLPLFIVLLVDLQADRRLSWCAYPAGALVLAYMLFALPLWLRRPNPIVFVPCDTAAAALYLLLLEHLTGGSWFLGFALPLCLSFGALLTALAVLLRCLRRGRLFVLGGFLMALGGLVLLTELLLARHFSLPFGGWSLYPLTALALLGGMLLFLAVCRSAREKMERRFFF